MLGINLTLNSIALASRTLTQKAVAVLRSFGSNAHVYMPGAATPVLGPELVVNGGFSDGLTGWATAANVSLSVVSGALRSQSTLSGAAARIASQTRSGLVIGATYQVTASVLGFGGAGAQAAVPSIQVRNLADTATTASIVAPAMTKCSISGTFVATDTSHRIRPRWDGNASTDTTSYLDFDNISVKEITSYTSWMNGLQAGNYLESTGQTPATVDSPVGLVLDGMGSAIAPAVGNFGVPVGYNNTLSSVTSTGFTTTAGATTASVYINLQTTVGTTYTLRGVLPTAGAGGVVAYARAGSDGTGTVIVVTSTIAASQGFTLTFTAITTTSCFLLLANNAAQSFSASGLAITTGIQATQATTANKPILRRGAVNLALQSATPAMQSITVTATPYTLALIGTGSVVVTGTGTGTLSGTGASDLVVLTFTPTAGAAIFTPVGSVTKIGVFRGTYTAAQIQALGGIPVTTTAPSSTEQGNYFWEFDGSNDSLSLESVPFQMADDHCVIAGVSVPNPAASVAVFDMRSNVSATPIVCKFAINAAPSEFSGQWRDDAGTLVQVNAGVLTASETFVGSLRQVGNVRIARKNGTLRGSNTTALGASSITSAAIGASPQATTTQFFNGPIYPIIAIKGTVSDAQLLNLEKWVANASGVTI